MGTRGSTLECPGLGELGSHPVAAEPMAKSLGQPLYLGSGYSGPAWASRCGAFAYVQTLLGKLPVGWGRGCRKLTQLFLTLSSVSFQEPSQA